MFHVLIPQALSKNAMERPTISEMVSDPWITEHSSGLLMAKYQSSDGSITHAASFKSSWEPARVGPGFSPGGKTVGVGETWVLYTSCL